MKTSQAGHGALVHALTSLEIESWRLLWEELAADADAMGDFEAWDSRRARVQPQAAELVQGFLAGEVALEDFRALFDARTKSSWEMPGLRGASGAMFLSTLVKYAPDTAELAAQLREVLRLPSSDEDGYARLRSFVGYLRAIARAGTVERRRIHPMRAAFFVTMWWSLQDPGQWPAFQPSSRLALQLEEGVYVPTGNVVDDYFVFRTKFLALAAVLGKTVWAIEYLCQWHQRRPPSERAPHLSAQQLGAPRFMPRRSRPLRAIGGRLSPALRLVAERPLVAQVRRARAANAVDEHTHWQWQLATIGRSLGCQVWIASNDHSKSWNGESLGALSIDRLPPLGMDADSQRLIQLIDVVWLRGTNQVVAAFEVERTTAVNSGLLRMADLAASAPNLNFPLYVVAPEARMGKVRRELMRPVCRLLELDRRVGFFSGEKLVESAESIMRWGDGPAVIDRLAQRV